MDTTARLILSLYFWLLVQSYALAQDVCGSIQYGVRVNDTYVRQNTERLEREGNFEVIERVNKSMKLYDEHKFELRISGAETYFHNIFQPKVEGGSMQEQIAAMGISAILRANDEFYYNRINGTTTHSVPQGTGFVGITIDPHDISWEIQSDTVRNLGGKMCLLAIGQDSTINSYNQRVVRTYEAWFTPDIPVPAGPQHFFGLPGLVLLVGEVGGRYQFYASSIDLSIPPCSTKIPNLPKFTTIYTKDEYDIYSGQLAAKRRARN